MDVVQADASFPPISVLALDPSPVLVMRSRALLVLLSLVLSSPMEVMAQTPTAQCMIGWEWVSRGGYEGARMCPDLAVVEPELSRTRSLFSSHNAPDQLSS